MKILITIGWPLHHGGHLSSTLCLGKNLVQQNTIVDVIAPIGPMATEFTQQGMTVMRCKSFINKLPWNLLAVPQIIIATTKGNYQIIHAMDYQALYPSFIAAFILGKPFVYTKAGGTVPAYSIPPCDSVIVYSKELLSGIIKKFPHIVKELTLNKARIDTELYYPDKLTRPQTKPLHIFMAMRLAESKRTWLSTAIKGMKQLIDDNISFRFLLAGDGPLRNEIEQQICEINNLQNRETIQLLGPIFSPEEMRAHYNSADIVIGHGRGILEAMACQKTAICLGEQGLATLVEPKTVEIISEYNFSGRHIEFYPKTCSHLGDIIKTISKTPLKIKELAIFSEKYIKKEYSAEIGAQLLLSTYTSSITSFSKKKSFIRANWIGREITTRLKKTFYQCT